MATLSNFLSGELGELVNNAYLLTGKQGKFKNLYGYTRSSNTYCTLRERGAGAGYQVPVGKKFLLLGGRYGRFAGTSTSGVGIQAGPNDVGLNTSTAPSTSEFLNTAAINLAIIGSELSGHWVHVRPFVAGQYIFFYNDDGSWDVEFYGLELDANAVTF